MKKHGRILKDWFNKDLYEVVCRLGIRGRGSCLFVDEIVVLGGSEGTPCRQTCPSVLVFSAGSVAWMGIGVRDIWSCTWKKWCSAAQKWDWRKATEYEVLLEYVECLTRNPGCSALHENPKSQWKWWLNEVALIFCWELKRNIFCLHNAGFCFILMFVLEMSNLVPEKIHVGLSAKT